MFASAIVGREDVPIPKGFASVCHRLLVLQAGIPEGDHVFDLVGHDPNEPIRP